jgi:putative membrane protein
MTPPSEHRLHPVALLLLIGKQVRELGFAVLAFFIFTRTGGGSEGAIGQVVAPVAGVLVLLGPSLAKLLTFRYRYDAEELVLRWGWLFRKERHLPYARIQSLDAKEQPPHRWTRTVAVKIETGGGAETDGDIPAIPREAFEAMRARVLSAKGGGLKADDAGAEQAGQELVRLSSRELMLAGLINNRGLVVGAGLIAIVFEWGFGDRLLAALFGPAIAEQGTSQAIWQLLRGSLVVTPQVLMAGALGVVGFLLLMRLFSLAFTVLRFHDHRLVRIGDDLRVTCGAITRSTSTTPLRRIQSLTIREGPLHRLVDRVTVSVATAGGMNLSEPIASRETLAPLLPRSRVNEMMRVALGGVDLPEQGWHRAAAPSVGRAIRGNVVGWSLLVAAAFVIGPPAAVLVACCAVVGIIAAVGRVLQFRWVAVDGGVALRTGWLWRKLTVARDDRIQLAILEQSPFDRRYGMAEVAVDTAGHLAPSLNFAWLTRIDAERLVARLNAGIAATEFST